MRRIGLLAMGVLCSLGAVAREEKDDFTEFVKEQEAEFDKFVDDANKEFISFMRNPWKEFKAEKPVPKRVKPEPVKPVVYDEKTAPKDPKPVCTSIEEIFDLTTSEGKQKPVVTVKDVEDITFDKPTVIVKKKKQPAVIVVEEKVVEKPVTKPVAKPGKDPETKPVVIPVKEPVAAPVVTPVKEPVVTPVEIPAVKPEPVVEPEVSTIFSTPLFAGGANRVKVVVCRPRVLYRRGIEG